MTDDELWRAIAKNTNAMFALFDQQHKAGIRRLPDFETSAMFSISRAIEKLEHEYQFYASALRRRYSLALNSETPSSVGSDQAA
jgi:hypothetical protein